MAVLAACQSASPRDQGGGSPDEEIPSGELAAGPERGLASSVPSADLAFSAESGRLAAGYKTHRVTVSEGIIDVVPQNVDPVSGEITSGSPLGLQTTSIQLGDDLLEGEVRGQRVVAANVVEIGRGEAVETVTNTDEGIEQAWTFDGLPANQGDLTVAVAVSGQRFVEKTDSGLHFRGTTYGFRYSNAVWRDADGVEYIVPAQYDNGRILLTVPVSVLEVSAFPAVLDPTVSAELFTDTPANGTTGANSRNQDLASNGSGYLVVWQDTRDGRNDDIFGARVDSAGMVMDTTSIRINAAAGVQQNPTVAYIGTGYVVAWETVVSAGNSNIVAAFVSNAGTVTQLGTVAATTANETLPSLAARGSSALLVWQNGADVRGSIVTASAAGASFAVAAGANIEKEPAVSSNPTGDYLVAYSETVATGNDDIRGVMVTSIGTPGTAFNIDTATGVQTTPATEFDGTNHVVVWNAKSDIAAARVGPTGTLVDVTPVVINANAFAQQFPDVSCTSATCLITWQDARNAASIRDVYGAVVTSALAITTNDIALAAQTHSQLSPAVATNGTQFYLTWTDNRDLEYFYVRGSITSTAGALTTTDGVVLARGSSRLGAPTTAQTTTVTDTFFSDTVSSDMNLSHVRFAGAGTQLDNPAKAVSTATGAQINPAAAFVGASSMVVWQDTRGTDRDIYAARTNPNDGALLDANGIAISTATGDQDAPAIASGGNSALIVWQDRRNGASTGFDIYGALVSSTGSITVNNISVCSQANDQSAPKVAYDSTNNVYLVVWNEPVGASSDIRGARISAAGVLLDANCGVPISASAGSQFSPDVTYGNGRFMVVWEDRRNDANLGDIYGTRVTANGSLAVLEPNGIAITQIPGSAQAAPSVGFGTSYAGSFLVAWADGRTPANGTDIWGVQINIVDGALGTAFAIANTTSNEGSPDVTPGAPQNPFNIVYTKTNTSLQTTRIQFRRITLGTAGGQPCSSGTQCATGFCSDGVCCDTACGGSDRTDCQACSARLGGSVDGTCTVVAASVRLICRDYANRTDSPNCDIREYCDGTDPLCPPDLGSRQGLACTKGGGGAGVCPSNSSTGAPHVCQ